MRCGISCLYFRPPSSAIEQRTSRRAKIVFALVALIAFLLTWLALHPYGRVVAPALAVAPASTLQYIIPDPAWAAMLDAADPSLFSPTYIRENQKVWDLALNDYPYSFHAHRPTPLPLPEKEPFSMPSLALGAPLPDSAPIRTIRSFPRRSTVVSFSKSLAPRLDTQTLPPSLAATDSRPLAPAEFLLAIRADGSLAFVFLLTSSGSDTLDIRATETLYRHRFLPDPSTPLLWGEAQFLWGTTD